MKVLVIPEDPTLDQYILKPIVEHVFKDLKRPARVFVLQDPHLRGVSEALDRKIIGQILDERPMIDLFLLIVDRDCQDGRQTQLHARITQARDSGKWLLGCLAIEEVEVWALALHRSALSAGWSEVRGECHPKEKYFEPLVREKRWQEGPGRGRASAMAGLAGNWRSLRGVCDELQKLQDDIAQWLQNL
jgi:hypothetical protein